jgi:hypothetical protein
VVVGELTMREMLAIVVITTAAFAIVAVVVLKLV